MDRHVGAWADFITELDRLAQHLMSVKGCELDVTYCRPPGSKPYRWVWSVSIPGGAALAEGCGPRELERAARAAGVEGA